MKAHQKFPSLFPICAALTLMFFLQQSYAANVTVSYTTAVVEKPARDPGDKLESKSQKAAAPAKVAGPLFSISLEPGGKATVSQSYTSPVVVTVYATWTQRGSTVVVTFAPEEGKRPLTLSRSGSKLVGSAWNAAEWGGKPSPSMHRDTSDPETAAASGGHHLSWHL